MLYLKRKLLGVVLSQRYLSTIDVPLPDTWDDVIELLPLLQQMGMNFMCQYQLVQESKLCSLWRPSFIKRSRIVF